MRYEDDKGNFIEFNPLLMPDRYEFMGDVGFAIGAKSGDIKSLLNDVKIIAKMMRFAGKFAKEVNWQIDAKKHDSWESLSSDPSSSQVLTLSSIAFIFGGLGGEKK